MVTLIGLVFLMHAIPNGGHTHLLCIKKVSCNEAPQQRYCANSWQALVAFVHSAPWSGKNNQAQRLVTLLHIREVLPTPQSPHLIKGWVFHNALRVFHNVLSVSNVLLVLHNVLQVFHDVLWVFRYVLLVVHHRSWCLGSHATISICTCTISNRCRDRQ